MGWNSRRLPQTYAAHDPPRTYVLFPRWNTSRILPPLVTYCRVCTRVCNYCFIFDTRARFCAPPWVIYVTRICNNAFKFFRRYLMNINSKCRGEKDFNGRIKKHAHKVYVLDVEKPRSTSANFSLKPRTLDDTVAVIARLIVHHVRSRACVAIWIRVYYMFYAQLRLAYARAYTRMLQRGRRLSCTARLSSSKADVVSTRREYSRTTHRINKIYPWTTHVRLSYFKNLPPHSARCPPSAPAAASMVISALRRTDFKGPRPVKNLQPPLAPPSPLVRKKKKKNNC